MTKKKTDDTMKEQAEAKILSLHFALFHPGLQTILYPAFLRARKKEQRARRRFASMPLSCLKDMVDF